MLVEATFAADLKTALISVAKQNAKDGVTMEQAMENLANAIASKVTVYIKTATVSTTVVGSSVSGGAVTGTGTGTLS